MWQDAAEEKHLEKKEASMVHLSSADTLQKPVSLFVDLAQTN
jgi:hypothetical protein